ncbi:MmgE/PrpD family protein [Paraburkholderia fungorum]|uniref:MmgE/PrpD family protein n=1 Tax=Paraburkholderia fungorum TaxID=134537 RepID=UPI0038BBF336
MSATESAIRRLAAWVAALTPADLPPAVATVATRATIDTIGVALAGSRTDVGSQARRFAGEIFGNGRATVWSSTLALTAPGAAFANGVAAHALDFDDNCYAGFVHASAVVVPAAWAASQAAGRSGSAYLASYVAGVEAEFAVAEAMGLAPYQRGWWTTSLYGTIGACAAACHAFGLDAHATASALGFAIAGTGGTKAGFGTDAKALMVGRAAQTGVSAALLAREGCTGPDNALDGVNGIAALTGAEAYSVTPFDTLGRTWRLLSPGLDVKRIPVCLSSHAAVDALRDLIGEGLDVRHIERIVCDVPPIVVKNLVYAQPATRQQAQFSLPYALAATLLHGDVTLAGFDPAALAAPELLAAMQRVRMHTSERWADPVRLADAPEGAWLRVELRDGRAIERFRSAAVGTAASPMSDGEFDRKFISCATAVHDAGTAATWLSTLREVGRVAALASLTP